MADDSGYGYMRRRDLPDRLVPVPPQATPLSELPRAVADAVKNPPEAAVAFFQLLYAKQCDNSRLLALASLDAGASGGGAGSTTTTEQVWYSRIARFCRRTVLVNTGGAIRFVANQILFDFSLFPLLSTNAVHAPWVYRFEDVMAAELGVVGTCTGALHFGLFLETGVAYSALTPDRPFVGFYCTMSAAGYGNWIAHVCGDAGADADTLDTGITSEDPHRLTVDINGGTGTVTFYIDGVLVHTVTNYAGTLSHPSDTTGLMWVAMAHGTGVRTSTLTVGYMMDCQANVGVRILDEAA